MREIKFRAWDKYRKEMDIVCDFDCVRTPPYYYHKLTNPSSEQNNIGYFPSQGVAKNRDNCDFILMQYTGLKDKNGKEIYEGDIVHVLDEIINDNDYIYNDWEIIYNNGCFHCQSLPLYEFLDEDKPFCTFEIIGNIYENKDLLNA